MELKYLRILRTQFRNQSEYKLEFIGEFVRVPVQIFLMYIFWKLVFEFSGKDVIGGLTFNSFVFYIAMATFISNAMSSWEVADKISNFIREGNTVILITRPVHFIKYFFFREAAEFLLYGISSVIFVMVVGWLIGWFVPTSITTILLFMISFLLGISLQFLVVMSLALVSFFIYAIWGLRALGDTMRYFFSGEIIPLSLFPGWLMVIASILPFKYTIFVPIFVYLEKYTVMDSLQMIGLQVVFIVIFYLLCQFIFKKGVQRTDSHGG